MFDLRQPELLHAQKQKNNRAENRLQKILQEVPEAYSP